MPPTQFPAISIGGMQFPQGYFEGITSGTHYYVHNSDGDNTNDGLLATTAKATIVNAVATATTNKHDVIWCLPGHVETISSAGALEFAKSDITVIFLGSGTNRAQIKFDTSTAADIDIIGNGITFIQPKFVVDIDALAGGIHVTGADFTMIKAEDYDSAGKAATDMIIATATAARLRILDYKYIESTTGTQKESRLQIAATPDITLANIDIVGDFDTGAIENGTAWIDATLQDINIDNQAPGPVVGILLQSASSGSMHNVYIRVASGTTYLTSNNDMQFFYCLGVGTDATAGSGIGNVVGTSIEGKIDIIDAYHDVGTANAVTNAVMSDVIGNKQDTAAAGAVTTVESLMAYMKQTVSAVLKIETAPMISTPATNSLAAFIASGGTALGSECGDSKSIIDAIGFDGAAVVAASAGMLRTMAGTQGVLKTTIADGTAIPDNSQGAGGLLATVSVGDVLIEEIIWQRGATNFTGPTNYEFTTDNVAGLTGAAGPNGVALLVKFNAAKTSVLSLDGATKQIPFILESGKKLYIHGDDAVTGAGGTTNFYIVYRRLADNSTLA